MLFCERAVLHYAVPHVNIYGQFIFVMDVTVVGFGE